MAYNSGPNKRMNGPDGRVRNTSTSNAARGNGVPGVPSSPKRPSIPGFGTSYGSVPGATAGMASAWAALQNVMAAMRAKRAGLKASFKSERAGIRGDAISAMSDAINAGIDSGLTGSSQVAQARLGVLADRRQQIEAAKTTMKQSIIDTKVAEQQQYMDYTIAQEQMQMQAAAARQQAALAQQAIDAQNANAAAMLDFFKNQPGGSLQLNPGAMVLGAPVTTTAKGNWKVSGMVFAPGTPLAAIEAAITAQRNQAEVTARGTFQRG